MQKFPTFFFWSHVPNKKKKKKKGEKIRCDNKVLQVKADNTSYVFTFPFPFVLQPTARNAKNHKTDSNSLCHSFFLSSFPTHWTLFPNGFKGSGISMIPVRMNLLRLDRFHFFLACFWTLSSCAQFERAKTRGKKHAAVWSERPS